MQTMGSDDLPCLPTIQFLITYSTASNQQLEAEKVLEEAKLCSLHAIKLAPM